ncbi:MAG: hypothetical protein WDW38_003879 [Sanguina aurantia]
MTSPPLRPSLTKQVVLSRFVSQTSERQQAVESQASKTAGSPPATETAAPLSHEESILLLLSTPGPFLQKAATVPLPAATPFFPAAVANGSTSISTSTSIALTSPSLDRASAGDGSVAAAYIVGFESGCSAGFRAGLATGLRCGPRTPPHGLLSRVPPRKAGRSHATDTRLAALPHSAPASMLAHLRSNASQRLEASADGLLARPSSTQQHSLAPQQHSLTPQQLPQQQTAEPTPSSWVGSSTGTLNAQPGTRCGAAAAPTITTPHGPPSDVGDKSELSLAHISAFLLSSAAGRLSAGSSVSGQRSHTSGPGTKGASASNLLDPNRFPVFETATDIPPEFLRAPSISKARHSSKGSPRSSAPSLLVPKSSDAHSLSERSASLRSATCLQVTGSSDRSSTSTSPDLLTPRPLTALCIEDDEEAQAMLQGVLEGLGWKVYHKLVGAEGLTFLNCATDLPDIVIISRTLQGSMDGLKVCNRIRERFSACQLTVVISVLDTDGPWVAAQAMENGADGVVTKPYQAPRVLRKLHTLIADTAESRLQQQAAEVQVAAWGTTLPSSRTPSAPQEESLLRLLPKSFQGQPQSQPPGGSVSQQGRQSTPLSQRLAAGWIATDGDDVPQQGHQQQLDGGRGGGRHSRSEARRQREQELELEREWEEDSVSHTASRTDSTRGSRTPGHSSLEVSTSNASPPVGGKVYFTSGWAGKPMIVEDEATEGGAWGRGTRVSAPNPSGRLLEQQPPAHTTGLHDALGAAAAANADPAQDPSAPPTRARAPLMAVPRHVAHPQNLEDDETDSKTLSFDDFAGGPQVRRRTSDSPSHSHSHSPATSSHFRPRTECPPPPTGAPLSSHAGAEPVSHPYRPSFSAAGQQSATHPAPCRGSGSGSGSAFEFGSRYHAANPAPPPASDTGGAPVRGHAGLTQGAVEAGGAASQAGTHVVGQVSGDDGWGVAGPQTGRSVVGGSAERRVVAPAHPAPDSPPQPQQRQQQLTQRTIPVTHSDPAPLQHSAAMLWMAATAATAPEVQPAAQAIPDHFAEFHQQRRQQQQVVPPPHQTQAVVMTSSFYAPSGFKAQSSAPDVAPAAPSAASVMAGTGPVSLAAGNHTAHQPSAPDRARAGRPEQQPRPGSPQDPTRQRLEGVRPTAQGLDPAWELPSAASESTLRDRPSPALLLQHWQQLQVLRHSHPSPQERHSPQAHPGHHAPKGSGTPPAPAHPSQPNATAAATPTGAPVVPPTRHQHPPRGLQQLQPSSGLRDSVTSNSSGCTASLSTSLHGRASRGDARLGGQSSNGSGGAAVRGANSFGRGLTQELDALQALSEAPGGGVRRAAAAAAVGRRWRRRQVRPCLGQDR